MILQNTELYLYNYKTSEIYDIMIVLTHGVYVKSLSTIDVNDHLKVFPIEIHLGGTIYGNIGVRSNKVTPGIITLFFTNREVQKQWVFILEQATHNYNIKNYYQLCDKRKKKESQRYKLEKKFTSMQMSVFQNFNYV